MIAALLRCFFSLQKIEYVNASNVWGVRETVRFPNLFALRDPF